MKIKTYLVEYVTGDTLQIKADSLGDLLSKLRNEPHFKTVKIANVFTREVTYVLQWRSSCNG